MDTTATTTSSSTPQPAPKYAGLRRLADWLLIVGFVAALAMPLGATFLRLDADSGAFENRRKKDFPRLTMSPKGVVAFLGPARDWFAENFGLRGLLVSSHGWFKVNVLGASASERVAIGKDGWYFYRLHGAIESYRAQTPLTEAELAQWSRVLKERTDWLAKRDCRYVFFFAPNKSTIYPEYLPTWANRVGEQSRLEQIQAYLQMQPNLTVVDLVAMLRSQKAVQLQTSKYHLYYLTDTHWNMVGAMLAADHIGTVLAQWYPAVGRQTWGYRTETDPRFSGDLMGMLGLFNLQFESVPVVVPSQGRLITEADVVTWPLVVENNDPAAANLPTAVVLCDSFGIKMIPFLNRQFRRVTYQWTDQFLPALIEKEKPDVVIQSLVERRLMDYAHWNPEGLE